MNKHIKNQLLKVKSCKINLDGNETTIVIPKTTEIIHNALNKGDVCLIKLNKKLLQPSINSTLETNWNAGRIPKYEYYKVELLDIINNMYKFTGIAVDNNTELFNESWFGWFPEEFFEIVERY